MIRKFFDWLQEWTFSDDENLFITLGKLLLVLTIFVVMIVAPIAYFSDGPSFTLQKAEWTCTESHEEWHDVPVGKVLVPEQENVCDNWKRK